MRVTLIAVGRLRPSLRSAANDYVTRLRRSWPVEERELREPGRSVPDPVRRREEGHRILAIVPPQSVLIALTRQGRAWSSAELARRMDRWRTEGRHLTVIIGGAAGLSEEVLDKAQVQWSLGPLTLPHELARVIVLEQLYRAGTILENHPYHRGGR